MSRKIHVLDDHTINKIAAGEVIENPASVVKELVENALDAKATEITVEIVSGGRQKICVSDNGCGMSYDDAMLCLERHATSKILEVEDIQALTTMGFRGEAVPSIASISKFMLLTSDNEDQKATLIMVEGGKILKCVPSSRSKGTTFEVKSLFFNVPVRKKFQRSPNYDTNEIQKVISHLSLASPEIKFTLISNNQTLISTHLSQSDVFLEKFQQRVEDVLGQEFFGGLSPIDFKKDGYHVAGFIGMPTFTRHNRTGQYLFINHRFVTSFTISEAVKNGYGTAIAANRHPVFALHLKMPQDLVDVNVHPQKKHVRLRQEIHLKELIAKAVDNALQKVGIDQGTSTFSFSSLPFAVSEPSFKSLEAASKEEVKWKPEKDHFTEKWVESAPLVSEKPNIQVPQVIATMPGYIFLNDQNGTLKIVDQRKAHFRLIFDDLQQGKKQGSSQALVVPISLDFSSSDACLLKENMIYFDKLGVVIEEFGANSFVVRQIPTRWKESDVQMIVLQMLDELKLFEKEDISKKIENEFLAKIAAKALISKIKKLSLLEAQGLVNQLFELENPTLCPFGKPIVIELTEKQISQYFV